MAGYRTSGDPFSSETFFGLWVLSLPASVCLSVRSSVCQSLTCPCNNSGSFQARVTNLDQRCKTSWLRSLLFCGWLNLTFKVKFNFKSQNFWFHYYWKYITTTWPPESQEYLDRFTGLAVSQYSSSAYNYIPRVFYGPDSFSVTTFCTDGDLGSRGYFGV